MMYSLACDYIFLLLSMTLYKCPSDHIFHIYLPVCFSKSSASMDSSRSGRKLIPEYRDPLIQSPSRTASVKNKSCTNGNTASDAAARSNSRTNKKLNSILVAAKGLGCATSISPVKEAITVRSVGLEAKRRQSEKAKRDGRFDQKTRGRSRRRTQGEAEASPAVVQVCCGPGILFSPDATCVDCVHSRRRSAAVTTRQREEVVFHFSPVFEEIQDDQFRDWRHDIEGMSYEELLNLSNKIGYESTGLKKDEMFRCLTKAKSRMDETLPLLLHAGGEWECSICQLHVNLNLLPGMAWFPIRHVRWSEFLFLM
ncbi:uncharacterized protein LOC116210027 isoform X2 [Punica granatum]|uniref:RING-type E3 ubiquitin transferase n=1 Tax=Punica granatum TaxID=22663 RepID=A0A6P8DQL9_PUNGR|nr:uncharacterized protein LOC116210027 isoform X2 [Punica granatum]